MPQLASQPSATEPARLAISTKFQSVGVPDQLDPACAAMLVPPAPPPWAHPLPEARRRFQQRLRDVSGPIPAIRSIETLWVEAETRSIPLTLYRPSLEENLPFLVFLHGGGFVLGNHDQYHSLCARLASDVGCVVASVGYALAPEHGFPQGLEDCRLAYTWLVQEHAALGLAEGRVALVGDSAGGNLVAALAILATQGHVPKPQAAWMIYPVLDWQASTPSRTRYAQGYGFETSHMDWYRDQYLSDPAQGQQVLASPARMSPQTAAAFPKTLIQTAGFDILRDEARDLATVLNAADRLLGYTCYEGTIHGFVQALDSVMAAHMALDEGVLWLRRVFGLLTPGRFEGPVRRRRP